MKNSNNARRMVWYAVVFGCGQQEEFGSYESARAFARENNHREGYVIFRFEKYVMFKVKK